MTHSLSMNILGALGYIIALGAFIFQKILYIRITTIVAGIIGIIYFYFFESTPMWIPVCGQAMFVIINFIEILILSKKDFSTQQTLSN